MCIFCVSAPRQVHWVASSFPFCIAQLNIQQMGCWPLVYPSTDGKDCNNRVEDKENEQDLFHECFTLSRH